MRNLLLRKDDEPPSTAYRPKKVAARAPATTFASEKAFVAASRFAARSMEGLLQRAWRPRTTVFKVPATWLIALIPPEAHTDPWRFVDAMLAELALLRPHMRSVVTWHQRKPSITLRRL
ncbi:MAG: hypothetical protein WAX89_06785 [Alphaproteobacteria bacterium]